MTKLDEKEIIRIFAKKLGISDLDDVALLDNEIVLKSDMLVASTDIPHGMKAWQVARKSIVSCMSDLAAKGIRPCAAIISLGIPKNCKRSYIKGLAEGFAIASNEFGVKIVGGDTNEACELVIDCSMIGFAAGKVPTRGGAKPGDIVTISGRFGLAPAGLALLLGNAMAVSSSSVFKKLAVKSVLEPKPRQRFGLALAKYFSSSIDSSDGLAISLYELASQSGVDIVIDSIPAVEGLDKFAQENNLDPRELVFHGGEEYEIVATIPHTRVRQADLAARRAAVGLHVIGRVQKGSGDIFVAKELLENKGYRHFHKR